jgi:UDP-N-acetylmuramoyl-L-alanyl-D-glutamate--2,6-diaminopimelate ligase
MERVGAGDKKVFVDYAHTPDALEKALKALKVFLKAHQKLWVVFGCGGDRDKAKRPLMGSLAAGIADQVILTSDNPRSERPDDILQMIKSGISPQFMEKVSLIEDRKSAIVSAISKMKVDDVLLIAGKGHENYQIVGHERRHFSDREVAQSALLRLGP